MHTTLREKKVVNDCHLEYDPNFKGVDGMEDHSFIYEFTLGNGTVYVYLTHKEFQELLEKSLTKANEFDRIKINEVLP